MNRSLIGWIVAAVLAVALGGVLIYEAASGGGESRKASLGSNQGVSSAISGDVNQIQQAKDDSTSGHQLPDLGAGQHATQLNANPKMRCDPNAEPNVFAEWRNNPDNLNQAASVADQIIVGTVMSSQQAAPFSVRAKGEPGGPLQTPVQDVTIHVDQAVTGNASQGDNVTIQRLGDAQGCYRVAGDSPYQRGQQYLLLLENGAGGRAPHVISPEGRYMVRANNTLQSDNENTFGEDIDGDRLSQVVAQLKAS